MVNLGEGDLLGKGKPTRGGLNMSETRTKGTLLLWYSGMAGTERWLLLLLGSGLGDADTGGSRMLEVLEADTGGSRMMEVLAADLGGSRMLEAGTGGSRKFGGLDPESAG